MIRVGFIGAVSKEWMGGLNYYKNLLFALSTIEEKRIEPIVFLGVKTEESIKAMFRQYAQVIEHPLFDRKSFQWFLWRVIHRLFDSEYFLERLLKQHHITVLSHASIVSLKSCKTINWIPDFQHLHLPAMFSASELRQRDDTFLHLAQYSDAIILSSYDALSDFAIFAPTYAPKAKILQFVSQPDKKYFELTEYDEKQLRAKYALSDPFFYLPNQFWKHKNHITVFEAITLLKEKEINITIVCTGHLHDYRNSEYIDTLQNYIQLHQLNDHIRLLGLVDYADVFALIKFSQAVINPSLFEGWSSTVEECKSVGKNMILSDINVHKEQYPQAVFFEKYSPSSLACILESYSTFKLHGQPILDLKKQMEIFAKRYETIVFEVIQ